MAAIVAMGCTRLLRGGHRLFLCWVSDEDSDACPSKCCVESCFVALGYVEAVSSNSSFLWQVVPGVEKGRNALRLWRASGLNISVPAIC